MYISETILYIGVTDVRKDLFEGQYKVPEGITYNSYLIVDERIAVLDTVDADFTEEWLENLDKALKGRQPDYLVVHHMEPDHSAGVAVFLQKYPGAVAVASEKAFALMSSFFGGNYEGRRLMVKEGDILSLGRHRLKFTLAPMVHWPEVVVSFEETEGILFSADAFGTFGVWSGADAVKAAEIKKVGKQEHNVVGKTQELTPLQQFWLPEARRYYFGIVGKYGAQVQALLNKLDGLDIRKICPLHGPVLAEDLPFFLGKYLTWAQYEAEEEGVVIAYASVYGRTEAAVVELANYLEQCHYPVVLFDLVRCDMSQAVAAVFQYSKLVLAATTYNGDVFPPMKYFIQHLTERKFQDRVIGLIENGSWAPVAAKAMRKMLEHCPNITYTDTTVRIISAMNEESHTQILQMAEELTQ